MIVLDPTQRRAVQMALDHPVSVITGGPGTGKTTIIRVLLDELGDTLVALCAPTGKAARRLSEQTGRPASTIHRLLGISPIGGFAHGPGNPFLHDVVICDETSMVDVELAAALLSAVRDGTRVVFVGDADQLPSVGPGSLLRDLIASGVIPVTRLDTIHRQQSESVIPWAARAVLEGQLPAADGIDCTWHEVEGCAETADAVVALAAQRGAQVLCPQRTTPVGVAALNARLQALLNPADEGRAEWRVGENVLREGDRVMHTRNNYQLEVFNGEVGRITGINGELEVDYGDRCVEYSRSDASQLTLCYATTIHKSQGSEYSGVIIPVHSANSYMLSRSLLYTAITRGKQRVWMVGDRKGLRRAVCNAETAKRYSALAGLLQAEV